MGCDWGLCRSLNALAGGEWEESCRCSLVNAMGLQLECARVLHEVLIVCVLTYESASVIWTK